MFHPIPPREIRDRLAAELDRGIDSWTPSGALLPRKGLLRWSILSLAERRPWPRSRRCWTVLRNGSILSSPALGEINATLAHRFTNALKRGVFITVVAEPSARVPEASEVKRRKDLLATDIISDYDMALIATPDLSICGFTDNPFLAAHLDNFYQMSLDRPE